MKKAPGELFYECWCSANGVQPYWSLLGRGLKYYYSVAEKEFISKCKEAIRSFDEQSNECPIPTLQEDA